MNGLEIFILVYFIGYVIAYFLYRQDVGHVRYWTIWERQKAFKVCLFSWMLVLVYGLIIIHEQLEPWIITRRIKRDEKIAKKKGTHAKW